MSRSQRGSVVVLLGLLGLFGGMAPASAVPEAPVPSAPTESLDPAGDPASIVHAQEYWIDMLGLEEVWERATGKGVTVAVIDTGVDGTHQDLKNAVVDGADVSGAGAQNGWEGLGAEPAHGTLVASMVAGHGHGGRDEQWPAGETGMVGTAPEATILPISVWMGTPNPGGVSVEEQIPQAVRTAVDRGADIINLSVGSSNTQWPKEWDEAFAYAQEHDVVVVASAGNRGAGVTQVGAPSTIPGVLSVGGIGRQGEASEESSSQGISIAVTAPSEDLVGAIPGDDYAYWGGTSGAAPMVSGIIALLREAHPEESAAQIIARVIRTAQDVGESGRDPLYGFGVIDPQAAMSDDVDVSEVQENPLGSVRQWAAVHRRASAEPEDGDQQPTAAPQHRPAEQVEPVAAPEAQAPARPARWLPPVVVLVFALWLTVLVIGTLTRLDRHIRHGLTSDSSADHE